MLESSYLNMKLNSITIENYRSIENATLEIKEIEGGYTYTLIGINESGKSSFLKAISLKDGLEPVINQDFFDSGKPISITFNYTFTDEEQKLIKDKLIEGGISNDSAGSYAIEEVEIIVFVEPVEPSIKKKIEVVLKDKDSKKAAVPEEKTTIKNFLEEQLLNTVLELAHKVVFWKSEQRFLITEPINLEEFLKSPETISIPLINCFELAGIKSLEEEIAKIRSNPAEVKNLANKLSDKVTEHIKRVWPGHPVRIEFQIDNMSLSFLIEDDGVKYSAKITAQRSDGFRQFISFLLTVSAQNVSGRLSNSILLLDEPETHLHPTGQENLMDELVNITCGKFNNVCIFATHSNYMIDKKHLDRCFRLIKEGNQKTEIIPIDGTTSSYAEVNYLVFGIATSDYHNELYGFLQERESLPTEKDFEPYLETRGIKRDRDYIKIQKDSTTNNYKVTLPTYIRHLIHHPENTKNKIFTLEELNQSIKLLVNIKNEVLVGLVKKKKELN